MPQSATEENVELRRYLRDLVALSTLPAVWVGQPPEAIVNGVAGALVGTLRLDFVYVRLLPGGDSDEMVEATHTQRGVVNRQRAAAIGQALDPWLTPQTLADVPSPPNPVGEGTVRLAVSPIGRSGTRLGWVAVGASREDFPSKYDLLLLNVVANQAAITLQAHQLRAVRDELAEQRRTDDILRQSEERFRALLEHGSDVITLHQRDRTMSYVSPSTTRVLGYDTDELLGRRSIDAVHPEDQDRFDHGWDDVLGRPGSVVTFRYRLRRRDGTWRWMEATATNLLDMSAVGAVVMNRRDVTEEAEAQRLLEERVTERTRELESLYRADAALYHSLRLEDVLQALVDVASEILGIDKSAVLVRDEDSGKLAVRAARGFQTSDGIQASMNVPILAGGDAFAIFNVCYTTPHTFTEEERRLLTALAQRAGLAIENARLYEAARGIAALEERQKLARELHDSVSQTLYAIALNAAAAREVLGADHARAAGLVGDMQRLAETGMAEMRALIFELRPESLQMEGLVGALEKQIAAVQARHRLAVSATLCAEPDAALRSKEAVYRIAQEALHNAARHARARAVNVVLDSDAGELVLHVSDDGRGFDPSMTFPGHLGLRSMRERAIAAGGALQIESAPGRGTAIMARVPSRASL